MIEHQIREVPDSVCEECPLLWMGECRAYEMPHSEEERIHSSAYVPGTRLPCVAWQRAGARLEQTNTVDYGTVLLLALVVLVLLICVQLVA